VHLVTPTTPAIAQVLQTRDKLDAETAQWAASISGGHVGRARRLAKDEDARARRKRALGLASAAARPNQAYLAAEEMVKAAETEAAEISAALDDVEMEELRTALGAGGTGKGAAGALRGSAGVIKELEARQKSRRTRNLRDAFDRALIDLAGLYRDALARSYGSTAVLNHPDMSEQIERMARGASPEALLKSIEAILECREALALNSKPKFAVYAMVAQLGAALR